MGALSDLLQRANPANDANGPAIAGRDSHDSHDSHALPLLRKTMTRAAQAESLPVDLVIGLEDAEVLAWAGYSFDELRTGLRGHAQMQGRIVPKRWTRAVVCDGCGPVLLWSHAPDAVIGCPWCLHRRAGRTVPRPKGANR
jgi:hypothetical protein